MQDASAPSRIDPAPDEWLNPERLHRLEVSLGANAPFLALSGLLAKAVDYWIRQELAQEAARSIQCWPEEERDAELVQLEQVWRAKHDPAELGLTDEQVRLKLTVQPGCQRWARQQWGHRLETLYLERKPQLDQASCRLIRLSSKHLAMELYHRLRAEEATFEDLAVRHGEGPERFKGGLLPMQPMASLPLGLGPVLARLSPGELTLPLSLGQGYAVVQLVALEPAQFNSAIEAKLLSQELQAWVVAMVPVLRSHLISSHSSLP